MASAHSLDPGYQTVHLAAQVTIVECPAGPGRRLWLEDHVQQMAGPGVQTFKVSCAFDSGGPWSGVNELFSALLPEIQSQRPDLMERHALELIYVLPRLRRSLTVHNPSLTDL